MMRSRVVGGTLRPYRIENTQYPNKLEIGPEPGSAQVPKPKPFPHLET